MFVLLRNTRHHKGLLSDSHVLQLPASVPGVRSAWRERKAPRPRIGVGWVGHSVSVAVSDALVLTAFARGVLGSLLDDMDAAESRLEEVGTLYAVLACLERKIERRASVGDGTVKLPIRRTPATPGSNPASQCICSPVDTRTFAHGPELRQPLLPRVRPCSNPCSTTTTNTSTSIGKARKNRDREDSLRALPRSRRSSRAYLRAYSS